MNQSIKRRENLNLLFFTIFAYFVHQSEAVITGDMTVSPQTVGSLSTLTFEVQLTQPIPANGKLVLDFSPGFDLKQTTNITCLNVYALNNLTGCKVDTLTELELNNAKSSDYLVIFTINNIILPRYVSSFFTVVTSFKSDGTQIENSGPTAFKFTTAPDNLNVTLNSISNLVGASTDLKITLSSSQSVLASGWIDISMPKWNAGTQSLSLVQPFFNLGTSAYSNSGYIIPCSSPDHSALLCYFILNAPSSLAAISTTFDTLRLKGFSQDFKIVTIQTQGTLFLNPPSTKQISTFSAGTYLSTGMMVTYQSKLILKVSQAATLQSKNVSLQVQDGSINAQSSYSFTVQTPLPGPVGLKIVIVIPKQLGLVSLSDSTSLVLTSAAGFAPVAEIPHLDILNQTNQTIALSLLVPNSNYYVDQGNYIRFDLFDIVNSPSILTTDSFQLYFYEFDDIIMSITSNITVTAVPGVLSNIQVLPNSYRVKDSVPYSFSFVTQNRVFKTSQIAITVPKEINVNNLTFTPVTTVAQDGSAKISYDSVNNRIVISNAFQQDFQTPQLVQFVINTGLQNAQSTQPISAFSISTLDNSGAIIDSGRQSTPLVFTPNEINSILTIACSNKQTASETEDVCTYKLQFIIGSQFPILAGSQIEIDLPSDLSLQSSTYTSSQSSTVGIADLSATFSVTLNKTTIIVSNAFKVTSAQNGIDFRQDSFAVQIAGVVSPRTTAPTLSFKARIRTSDGFLQYTRLQGVYANVYQARPFQTALVKRSNETNGDDSGVYNFTLQLASVVYPNEFIKITPPTGVIINPGGQGQCIGTRLLSTTLGCSIIQGSLYVMIEPADTKVLQFNPGDTLMFQVSDIRNPITLKPTPSFDIYVVTSTSQNYYVNQIIQGLSVLNVNEGQLTNVRMLPDTNQFGAVTDYSIYFVTSNLINTDSYIQIQFPPNFYNFAGNAWPCQSIKNIQQSLICTPSNNGTMINITKGYSAGPLLAGSEVGLKLKSVRNPTKSVSNQIINQQFYIESITVENYGVDRSSNLNFSIGCSYPCQSCESVQTRCTSCQMLNAFTPLYLYGYTCNIQCPIGSYADANLTCQNCDPLCKQCSKAPQICDSCKDNMGYPYLTPQNTCTSKCLDGTYLDPSDKTCYKCELHCNTCSSAIECLSCDPGYYFIQGQCLSTCPANSIEFDSVEVQECLLCQDPCASCVETIDKCTSCNPSTFLYGNNCVKKCPTTYLPDQNNVCYKASQKTYPFISLVIPGFILILIATSYCKTKSTEKATILMALESCGMVIFWIYMLVFLIMDGHQASATLVSIGLFANFVINYLWWEYYNDKLYKNDLEFQEFTKSNSKTVEFIKIICLIINFDFIRICYSQGWNLNQLKADMLKKDKHYKRINRYELFQITFVYLFTVIAAAYNLPYTWYGRQIFWIDIECLGLGVFMIIFKLVLIFQAEKEYIMKTIHSLNLDLHKKQIKVQSANVDDDEQDENHQNALVVARNIGANGIKSTRDQIKELNNEQRVLAVKAVFHKLLTGKDLGEGQVQKDKYLLNHGGQLEKYKTHQIIKKDYQQVDNTLIPNNTTETFDDAAQQTMVLRQEDSDEVPNSGKRMFNDKELINFQSAPLNANSALNGNEELDLRHKKLMEELKNRNNPLFSKKDLKSKNLKDMEFDDISQQSKLNQKKTQKVMAQLQQDSDDQIEKFNSETWGAGASKVVAEHYNTLQAREKVFTDKKDLNWVQADKSTIPGNIQTKKLNQQQFQDKIEEVNQEQQAKRLAKHKALEFSESSKKLHVQLTAQQDENQKIRDFIKQLELQIASENGRLNGVRQSKKEELEFAENAFFTSNEDGMGVSPNQFLSQNHQPVKPSHNPTKPSEVQSMPENEEKGKDNSAYSGRINPASIEAKSRIESGGNKSISALEIKAIGNLNIENEANSDSNSENNKIENSIIVRSYKQNPSGSANVVSKEKKRKQKMSKRSMSRSKSPPRLRDNQKSKSKIRTSPGRKRSNSKRNRSRSKSKVGRKRSQKKTLVKSKRQKSLAVPSSGGKAVSDSGEQSHRGRTKSNRRNQKRKVSRNGSETKIRELKNTIGKVTRKPHASQSSFSGIKPASNEDKRELEHRPINKERDKYEYYSTEDEFGLPINKLRKKVQQKGKKPVQGSTDDDLEFYSSIDEHGNRVQKLKKKRANLRAKSQNLLKPVTVPIKQYNFRPERPEQNMSVEQSTIKGSVMGHTGENFTRFSLESRKSNTTDQVNKQRSKSNIQPVLIGTEVQSQMTSYRNRKEIERSIPNSQLLKQAGITVIKANVSKSQKRQKKVSAQPRDFSGPYFNHTNFEKAVIATNGRAPYDNKEVEVITKTKEFDPREFNFRNQKGWTALNDTKLFVEKSTVSQNSPRRIPRIVNNEADASASQTATTVFQGFNHQSNNLLGSVQMTEAKPPATGNLAMTQQQFGFGGSPVTMQGGQNVNATEGNNLSPYMEDTSSPDGKPVRNLMYEQAQSYLQSQQ